MLPRLPEPAMHLDTVLTFCNCDRVTIYGLVVSRIPPSGTTRAGDEGVVAGSSERPLLDEVRGHCMTCPIARDAREERRA